MLVGAVPIAEEPLIFKFLWDVESRVKISKDDKIGRAKDRDFSIELVDGPIKPVCHDVRRCS